MVCTLAPVDDIQKTWQDYKRDSGNKALRNKLVEQYLPLVEHNARRVWARLPDAVELDDLVSAGVFGLIDAIEAFDLSRGVKFETYCVQRIRGAILDELRANDWVPRLVRNRGSKLAQATEALAVRHGRQPTQQELAEHVGVSARELEKLIRDAQVVSLTSLNSRRYQSDSNREVGEVHILEDKKGEDPTRRVRKNDLMRLVTKGLNRNERLIIILYYYEELTMKEVGETLGLSESRVSQMHTALVRRIQAQLHQRRSEFAA